MTLKEKIFELLNEKEQSKSSVQRKLEVFIIILIIANVLAIILESYEGINNKYGAFFYWFEVISVIIFTLEYIARVWTAPLRFSHLSTTKARGKFIFSTLGLIDLLAIIPFYLPFFLVLDLRFIRILRVLRLFRVFKLNRYTKALHIIGKIFIDKRMELMMTVFVTFLLLLISSVIMYNLEHDVQPDQFPDIISTFWWAIATLTTVGYGDVYPVTGWGKLISGIIALLGIGLVCLPTGIISASFIEELEQREEDKAKKISKGYKYCPHCGERLV